MPPRRPRGAPPPAASPAVPAVRAPPVPADRPITDLPAWLATVDEYLALAGVGLTRRQQHILGAAIGELAKDEEVARRVALALIRAFKVARQPEEPMPVIDGRRLDEMTCCFLLGSQRGAWPTQKDLER